MNAAFTAAHAIQSALRQRGVFYTHPTEGTVDVFTTESMVTLITEACAVRVKPLVWTPWNGGFNAHAGGIRIFHALTLGVAPPLKGHLIRMSDDHRSWHPTLEAAQAAAQEQWNEFVLAAIQQP